MKKTKIILGLILLCSFMGKAQKKAGKWDGYAIDIARSYKIEAGKPEKKEIYMFKTYQDKKTAVEVAYEKLNKNLNDATYPSQKLEAEKKEFVSLMKGKIEQEREEDVWS
jgi:hypothetical protein